MCLDFGKAIANSWSVLASEVFARFDVLTTTSRSNGWNRRACGTTGDARTKRKARIVSAFARDLVLSWRALVGTPSSYDLLRFTSLEVRTYMYHTILPTVTT